MSLRGIALSLALAGLAGGCSTDPDSGPTGDPGAADDGDSIPALYSDSSTLKFDLFAPLTLLNQFGTVGELDGVLRISKIDVPIKISGRGKTSKFECSFDKLEVSIPDESEELTVGTPFEGISSFKIGTHCAPESLVIGEELEEGSLTSFGRLVSDKAPFREEFLHEIYAELTPFSHLTRRSSIKYHDTSPGASKKAFTKPAFLLERFKNVRKRADAVELDTDQIKSHTDVDQNHLALDFLFQVMILNTDWQVGDLVLNGTVEIVEGGVEGPRTLWNHHAMQLPKNGTKPGLRIPVPGDFDIALLGTVWPDRVLPESQKESFDIPDFGKEYARRLAFFRDQFTASEQAFAVDRVVSAREAIMGRLSAASLDPDGAEIIAGAIDAFYAELEK